MGLMRLMSLPPLQHSNAPSLHHFALFHFVPPSRPTEPTLCECEENGRHHRQGEEKGWYVAGAVAVQVEGMNYADGQHVPVNRSADHDHRQHR